MRTPYYREQALEGIAREVITAYDPNLYYGVPRMIPIEDIIEAQGITLEYQCLRKTGCVLGETIFDDGGAIIYDYDIPGYTVIAVKSGTISSLETPMWCSSKDYNKKGRRKKMAIFMTGDTHGDFSRLRPVAFREQGGLTKDDYLIICGDFGGVWDGSEIEQQWLDWLEDRSFTTLFVSGNHENYDLLRSYPTSVWHGGLVQPIRPSVLHLMRGQLYEICGKKIFTMGGASSHDIRDGILEPDDPNFERMLRQLNAAGALYRVNHRSWWKEELPGEDEYRTAREALDKTGWDVDYIITHCCPSSIQDTFSGGLFQRDALTDFLDEVRERCRFQYWFFGHYHENMVVEKEFVMLYKQIIRLK